MDTEHQDKLCAALASEKQAIERTSTLIKAAALLGGRYSPGRIDLPCGRVVTFDSQGRIWTDWEPRRWALVQDGQTPGRIASTIRKMLVDHDEYLLTNPQ